MPIKTLDQAALNKKLWEALQHPNPTEAIANQYIDMGATDYNGYDINKGRTSLWYALHLRYFRVVKSLVNHGATDRAPRRGLYEGFSVLMKALQVEDLDTAKILIDRGAKDSVSVSGDNHVDRGVSALWLALALLTDCMNTTPPDIARSQILTEIILKLIERTLIKTTFFERTTSLNTFPSYGKYQNWSLLYLAAVRLKDYNIVAHLIKAGAIDCILPRDDYSSVLEFFLSEDRFDLACQLAKNTPSFVYNNTPVLLKALEKGDLHTALVLARAGMENSSCNYATSLWVTLYRLNLEQQTESPDANQIQILRKILDVLITCSPNAISAQGDDQGLSALFLLLKLKLFAHAKILSDRDASNSAIVRGQFLVGDSTLRLALELDQDYIIDKLLERGATDTRVMQTGDSALMCALLKNNFPVAAELIKRGAQDTILLSGPNKGISCIGLCIRDGYFAELKQLLDNNHENNSILTTLNKFRTEVIKCLITLQINGVDAPVFSELKKYKCPISGRLILEPIQVDDYIYDRESWQLANNSKELPSMDIVVANDITKLITKAGNALNSLITEPDVHDVCNISQNLRHRHKMS